MPIELIKAGEGNKVTVRVTGRLHDEDYKAFVPEIERFIEEHGHVRMLAEFEDFHGWDVHAAWDDLKFNIKHRNHLDALAIVGEKKWHKWMADACEAFTRADVRYFDHDHLREAQGWIDQARAGG